MTALLLVASALFGAVSHAADLNPHVLAVIDEIAVDGSHPYAWDRTDHTDGVMTEVRWTDAVLARPDGQGVHCSGVTYEVYIRALRQAVQTESDVDSALLAGLKDPWYVRGKGERGPVDALVEAGLAVAVERLEDLQPGDFVQFWRNNGNGHSAIFVGFRRTRTGAVRSLVFWSAQSSSGGIGRRYVSVGPRSSQITPGRWYAARAQVPPPLPLPSEPQPHAGVPLLFPSW